MNVGVAGESTVQVNIDSQASAVNGTTRSTSTGGASAAGGSVSETNPCSRTSSCAESGIFETSSGGGDGDGSSSNCDSEDEGDLLLSPLASARSRLSQLLGGGLAVAPAACTAAGTATIDPDSVLPPRPLYYNPAELGELGEEWKKEAHTGTGARLITPAPVHVWKCPTSEPIGKSLKVRRESDFISSLQFRTAHHFVLLSHTRTCPPGPTT